MEIISIEGNTLSPSINLNIKNGVFEFEGNSIMDDAAVFYKPIIEFVEKYSLKPASITMVNIRFQFVTLPSSKCILEIFKKLESINKLGVNKVEVNWYYSVDEMLKAGKDFQTILKIPFNMIEE